MKEIIRPSGYFDIYVLRNLPSEQQKDRCTPITFRRIRQYLIKEAAWVYIPALNECEVPIAYRTGSHINTLLWYHIGLRIYLYARRRILWGQWAPGSIESSTFQ